MYPKIQTSKDIIYKIKNIQSCFNNPVKICPNKRKSDNIIEKSKLLSLFKKTNSNIETSGSSNLKNENKVICKSGIKKQNNINIKFNDLVAESNKSEDSNNHLELALIIKKKRKSTINKKSKLIGCNELNFDINKDKNENKEENKKQKKTISNSISKVILGAQKEENIFFKNIKKKFFCCS